MIRIPTGPVSKNTARNVSLLLGLAAIATSFIPVLAPYAVVVREVGVLLGGLGLTLGKAEAP